MFVQNATRPFVVAAFPPRFVVFSLVSLAIGLCYALGTRQAWRRLRHHDPPW